MPRPWSEVAASPQFQALSPTDQEAARNQYFDEVVAPRISADDLPLARRQFDQETARGAFAPGVQSGDEARALAAGDTRAKMRLPDIERAYDTAAARGDRREAQTMARAFVDREHADSPTLMGVDDRLRAFARGVPVAGGLADEINAGLSALTGGDYQKALDYQRARDAAFDEAHPKESMATQMAGGLASGIGMGAAAAPVLQIMPRLGALASGAGGGAVLGGVDAFTRGEDGFNNRMANAGTGAVVGGALGLAAPVVARGIEKGTSTVLDWLAKPKELSRIGLSRPSASVLTRALEADGSLGGQGARNIAAAGPDAMLADAGPNAAAVLDTAIQRGGRGANEAQRAIGERLDRAGQNVVRALDDTLGSPQGVATTETTLRQGTAAGRSAAYDAAYAQPIDYARPEAREIEGFLRRLPATVVEKANRLMRLEGEESQQIMARIHQDGSVTYERMPDVRQLDYITRAMGDIARNGDGQGVLGGNTQEGRAFGNLARNIRDRLRTLVPEYGTALDTAAEPIAARNALQLGSHALSRGMARDELAQEIQGMSRAELDQVRQGIRSQIDETLANVKRSIADPNVDARQAVLAIKDLSSDAAREKIRMVVGDEAARNLFGRIDEAARAFDLRARVAENSKTFARQATNQAIEDATSPGAFGLLTRGQPLNAGKRLVQVLLGTTPEAQVARQDRIYGEVVNALVNSRGRDAQRLVRALADANRMQGQHQDLARALGVLGAGAGAGAAYPYLAGGLGAQR